MRKFLFETLIKGFILFILLASLVSCESTILKKGHQLYHQGKYEEAFREFNGGLAKNPDSEILNFNAGAALYQKRDYEKAIEHFTKALKTENMDLENKANYNIGNCKYRQGHQSEKTDLARAADLYREALDYYQRAIELNEKDGDAKYNHSYVEKKLNGILPQLQKQKVVKPKGGVQEQKSEFHQPQKSIASSPEATVPKDPGHLNQTQHDPIQQAKRRRELKEAHQMKGERIEMSKEEAEMLLEEYLQEGETMSEIKSGKRRGHHSEVQKDW